MADNAQQTSNVRRFNAPRFRNVPGVKGDTEKLKAVTEALGGTARLIAFIKAFVQLRFDTTGWRSVKDITSRDTKHAPKKPNTPATEMLDVPFQSLTATLAAVVAERSKGGIKLTRDESLSVIAALKEDAETLEAAGVRIWDDMNTQMGYVTIGLAALPSGQIPAEAFEQAASIEF